MKNKVWLSFLIVVVVSLVAVVLGYIAPPESVDHHMSHHYHEHTKYTEHEEGSDNVDITRHKSVSKVVSPIPSDTEVDKKLAKIGWLLFKDPGLSSNNQISCESCHQLSTNGAERTEISTGVGGQGTRNSLTVFNVAHNYRFFWDGRANSLADQLDGPVHNVLEMDSDWNRITDYIEGSALYQKQFSDAGLNIDEANVKKALVEFMNALTTPNSQFDQYLRGDQAALNAQQLRGWETFQKEGCITCHRGTNIGGGMMMRFGFFGEDKMGNQRSDDKGRFQFTEQAKDMYLFRVASLRNVAKTAPYFHDGKTQTLKEAIKIMGESQLGKTLDSQSIDDIHAFLTTLSGPQPAILEEFANGKE